MGTNHGVHNRSAHLLWTRGSLLYGLSGDHILQFGELSTVRGETSTGNEPRAVGHASRNVGRGSKS